jgi:iron complex outermembrane receptor protein
MYLKNFFLYSLFSLTLIFASDEHLSTYTLNDFIITSSPLALDSSEITQSSTVIANDALNDLRADTIASTLSQQPGISQTYYGPNANRPIIRGLGGYRVNVLENGLSSFDLSASSNDHAVTINPLLIERIEILRGSSTLIHGSNSIGGIVNIFDNSIPTLSGNTPLNNELRIKKTGADNGTHASGILFHEAGDFIFQINASSAKTQDYETPSFEKHGHEHHHHTQYAKANADGTFIEDGEFSEAEEEEEEEAFFSKVENTYSDTNTFGFGGSYNHDKGFVGISFSDYTSVYGVPNHEDSVVSIEKEKISLQSVYNFDSGYFDSMNFQLAHGDYSHSEEAGHEGEEVELYELEDNSFELHEHEDHDHHAKFLYEGIDSKLIFTKESAASSTALNLSYTDFDMQIDGEESYLAAMNHNASENEENEEYASDTDGVNGVMAESTNLRINNDKTKRYGLGFMHKKAISDNLSINAGIRYESASRDYDALTRVEHEEDATNADFSRDDSTTNASIGFIAKHSDSITFSGNLHYSERIPETSELYSSGAHHATESFEIGNSDLENEESVGLEFSIQNEQGAFNQKLSVFYNDYNNFIYQSDTGFKTGTDKWRLATAEDATEAQLAVDENGSPSPVTLIPGQDYIRAEFEELSIRQYKGVEAEVYGLEYEFDYQINATSYITGFADSITGKNKTDGISLPRIPPYRFGVAYHVQVDQFKFNLNGIYHGKQNDLGAEEETTDSYTILNARIGYFPNKNNNSEFYCKVNNLTDKLAFVHTSFLKESAPLPGRSVEIGYNLSF